MQDAGREWPWHWRFPATRKYLHPETGHLRAHHLHETVAQTAVREAVGKAGISKRARATRSAIPSPPNSSRRQLGHTNVATTMIYTHVLNQGPSGARSPADRLLDD